MKTETLRFLDFKDYLFPISKSDVDLLLENRIQSTQFPNDVLSFLKHALGKNVTIETFSMPQVFSDLKAHFLQSLPTEVRVKHEANWILLAQPKEGNAPVHDELIKSRLKLLQHVVGRYCLSCNIQHKHKPGLLLTRLEFSFDNSIPNHQHYDNPTLDKDHSVELELSKLCKLEMSVRKLPGLVTRQSIDSQGNKSSKKFQVPIDHFHLEVKDIDGTGFKTTLQRSFPASSLDKEQIIDMMKFLLSLTKGKKS